MKIILFVGFLSNQGLVHKTFDASKEIAASAQEQNASIEEINSSIQVISELSEETKQNVASALMDELMYLKALEVKKHAEKSTNISNQNLIDLASSLGIDQMDVTDQNGKIILSNLQSSLGVNLYQLKMDLEKLDMRKYLFDDKNLYSVGKLTTSVQTGKLFKFSSIPGNTVGLVYQVAFSYDSLLKLLER